MKQNRLVIAGSRSGVGKTTISLGLMAVFSQQGLQVQPYKVGPDYIDPGFHTLITGNKSYNLDSYFLGGTGVQQLFMQSSKQADLAIIEGVMGLYDGKGSAAASSTAEIAKLLAAPVILVIDAAKIAQSAAAVVYGYQHYDPEVDLQGVIINNVSSKHHYQLLKTALLNRLAGVKVLGYLPKNLELKLAERHLGLVPVQESIQLKEFSQQLKKYLNNYLDLAAILELAESVEELVINCSANTKTIEKPVNLAAFPNRAKQQPPLRIGIAYDQAFNFYYQFNFDLLRKAGAELVFFSPLHDKKLPEVAAVYLGGGFPESFLPDLAANQEFKVDFIRQVKAGLPLYAECGGLMYLANSVINLKGESYPMTAILDAEVVMTDRLQAMGYREVTAQQDSLLFKTGQQARGHLFHYSKLKRVASNLTASYLTKKGNLGYQPQPNVLCSYLHLHFASNPELIKNLLEQASKYQIYQERNN